MKLVEVIAGGASRAEAASARRASSARRWASASSTAADVAGLRRQPLQPAVRPRGAALPAGAGRRRRDDRPHLPPRRRLSHGPVRAAGPRRHRHRLRGLLSFAELGFGEPRWRPSPLSARMVAAGWLRPQDRPRLVRVRRRRAAPPRRPRAADRRPGRRVDRRRHRAPARADALRDSRQSAAVDCDGTTTATCRSTAARRRAARRASRSTRFVPLPTGRRGRLGDGRPSAAFFEALGLHTARVARLPGGVLGADGLPARQRGALRARRGRRPAPRTSTPGLELGLNHPRGPFAWARGDRPDERARGRSTRCARSRRRRTARRAGAARDEPRRSASTT